MAKLSQKDISIILELYEKLGTYSGVAKETGRSPATVKKYVSEFQNQEAEIAKQKAKIAEAPYDGPFFEISDMPMLSIDENLMQLTDEEKV